MNRRNFIKGVLSTAAGFTILPGTGRGWALDKRRWIYIPGVDRWTEAGNAYITRSRYLSPTDRRWVKYVFPKSATLDPSVLLEVPPNFKENQPKRFMMANDVIRCSGGTPVFIDVNPTERELVGRDCRVTLEPSNEYTTVPGSKSSKVDLSKYKGDWER